MLRTSGSDNAYNCNRLLVHIAPMNEPIQKVFLKSLLALLLHVSLHQTSWTLRRTRHVRHHARRSMLATHGKQCIHNGDQLPRMGMQQSEEDANTTHETLPSQWLTRVCRHVHTSSAAKNNLRQLVCSVHDGLLLQASTSSANYEDKHSAFPVHLLRPLEHIILDTTLTARRQWHTILQQIIRIPL